MSSFEPHLFPPGLAVEVTHIGVVVEVLALTVADGTLRFRRLATVLCGATVPDEAAAGLAQPADGGLLHSTSWRFQPPATVVLTYVSVPDRHPDLAGRPVKVGMTQSPDATRPGAGPDLDVLDAVATHACRHLAFLATTDPAVNRALKRHPDIEALLRRFTPDVAGQVNLLPSQRCACLQGQNLAYGEVMLRSDR